MQTAYNAKSRPKNYIFTISPAVVVTGGLIHWLAHAPFQHFIPTLQQCPTQKDVCQMTWGIIQ